MHNSYVNEHKYIEFSDTDVPFLYKTVSQKRTQLHVRRSQHVQTVSRQAPIVHSQPVQRGNIILGNIKSVVLFVLMGSAVISALDTAKPSIVAGLRR